MRVVVTGANGFIGSALCAQLASQDHEVVKAVRSPHAPGQVGVGDIGPDTDWRPVFAGGKVEYGPSAVVHLAARVHVLGSKADNEGRRPKQSAPEDELDSFRAVNTEGTLHLARQAAAAGVKRFVFVSSIKVNGEGRAEPYLEDDAAAPRDAYAISKSEAEEGLRQLAQESGLEVVILRPPLVYGPGVGANFLRLMEWINAGLPLPFGAVHNRRSLIFVGNLVDAIGACLIHPAAAGKTYVVSDGDDVSTPGLVRTLARHMRRRPRLLPVPPRALELAAGLTGKRNQMQRLLGSLAVDSRLIRRELGWQPPFSMQQGLSATAEWFRHRQEKEFSQC